MTTTTTNYGFLKYSSGETPWSHSSGLDAIDGELARPRPLVSSPTVGATTTCDLSVSRVFKFTVSQATTLAFTNVPSSSFGVPVDLVITNGAAFTLTFPGSVTWLFGVIPDFQTSGVDHVRMRTVDGGTTWYAAHFGKNVRYGGAVRAGAGTSTFQYKTELVQNITGEQTTGSTSEVSLAAINLQANSLAGNDMVRIKVVGNAVAQAAQLRVKFGASYVLNIAGGNNIASGNVFEAEVVIRRTGAATQKAVGRVLQGTAVVALERATPAETLSGTIVMDVRGNTAVGGGTLNVDIVTVEFLSG